MKKDLEFSVNKHHLKVPADELLFDIIYIIIISKITQIIFAGSSIDLKIVISSIIVFGILVAIWFMRVNHLNRIHLLQVELDNFEFKSERLTYIEIVVLVSILYTIQNFSIENMLLITASTLLISFLSINRVRKKIVNDIETHDKFHQEYEPGERMRKRIEINVGYIYERLIIVIVLFMGEILSAAFNTVNNSSTMFLITVLIVCIFNANVKIFNASQKYLEENNNPRAYRTTTDYAKSLLTLLLGILISIEASHEVVFARIITLLVLVIYFIFEQRMKMVTKLNTNYRVIFTNLVIIIALLFGTDFPGYISIILGVIGFVVNMFYTKKA